MDHGDFKKRIRKLGIERWPYSYKKPVGEDEVSLKMFHDFQLQQNTTQKPTEKMKIKNLLN